MSLVWLALVAIAVWALVQLGRQTERRGRGHWRITATLFSAVMIAGGALAAARGAWLPAVVLAGAGLWLTLSSRQRRAEPRRPDPRRDAMSEAEARRLLGTAADATPKQINDAWKRLMARAHPDTGGSEGLAAQLNAARDRLLGR